MAYNQVNLDREKLEIVRTIAVKNGIERPTNQQLTDLAFEIATKTILNLNPLDFSNAVKLKK